MNKNDICIEMMIQFKEEYLRLVNEEKDLGKIVFLWAPQWVK